MNKPQEYRRDEHCVYLTDYHLVLPTKYRHPVITDELWKYLYGKLLEITQCYPKIYFKEANHDRDHVHLLVSIPPMVSVGSVVRLIKTNTARKSRRSFPSSKNTTGVSTVFGRQDISFPLSASPQRPSKDILQTKVNRIQVKKLRFLTNAGYPERKLGVIHFEFYTSFSFGKTVLTACS